jgi:hypothetical protein
VRAKAHKAGFSTRRYIIKRFDVRGQIVHTPEGKQVRYTCGLIEAAQAEQTEQAANEANKETTTSRCFY